MGTHQDMAYVSDMANRLGDELVEAHRRAVMGVARHVAKSLRTEIRGATGGDSRLSGARNARIGMRFEKHLGGATPSVEVIPTGPIMLVEEDVGPHMIYPREGRKALKLKSGVYRPSVRHPGSRGRHPWRNGIRKGEADAGRVYDTIVQQAIREALSV